MRMPRLAAWTVALVVAAAGCNADRSRDDAASKEAGTSGATTAATSDANDPATMTVTGCLQQGDGQGEFILSQVTTSQPQPVATGGTGQSGAVQEKQRDAAARAYRLSGGPEDLRDWVGHEVRVRGKLEDRGGVQSPDANRQPKEGDLAKLEVTSAESVADTCGAGRR